MNRELKRYLNAVVVLLCLIVGLLATILWVSIETKSVSFYLVPIVVAAIVGWVGWLVAQSYA